jgi:hypothetical protein
MLCKIRVVVAGEKIKPYHEDRMCLMVTGSRRVRTIGILISDVRPFAYFLPIFLQTDAKRHKQTLEGFAAGWMASVLETER